MAQDTPIPVTVSRHPHRVSAILNKNTRELTEVDGGLPLKERARRAKERGKPLKE
jgi:hypothetical protein